MRQIKYKTADNCQVNIQLLEKAIRTYGDDFVKFNYSNKYSISITELDVGIEQLMVMTANGNGIIIQEYSTMNPVFITDFMISEMTKESISYGYKGEPKEAQISLPSGLLLKGQKITLTYNTEVEEYQVYTYGAKDRGIMIATLTNNLNEAEGIELMDLFFNSLEITMK